MPDDSVLVGTLSVVTVLVWTGDFVSVLDISGSLSFVPEFDDVELESVLASEGFVLSVDLALDAAVIFGKQKKNQDVVLIRVKTHVKYIPG